MKTIIQSLILAFFLLISIGSCLCKILGKDCYTLNYGIRPELMSLMPGVRVANNMYYCPLSKKVSFPGKLCRCIKTSGGLATGSCVAFPPACPLRLSVQLINVCKNLPTASCSDGTTLYYLCIYEGNQISREFLTSLHLSGDYFTSFDRNFH